MVRETRHLWIGNLPENAREEHILHHFQRFGPVQSVKILSKKDECEAATVAFMDIKSAGNALRVEHTLEGRLLRTDYYDPSSFKNSGPGPGGGGTPSTPNPNRRLHSGSDETYEKSRSSHSYGGSLGGGGATRDYCFSRSRYGSSEEFGRQRRLHSLLPPPSSSSYNRSSLYSERHYSSSSHWTSGGNAQIPSAQYLKEDSDSKRIPKRIHNGSGSGGGGVSKTSLRRSSKTHISKKKSLGRKSRSSDSGSESSCSDSGGSRSSSTSRSSRSSRSSSHSSSRSSSSNATTSGRLNSSSRLVKPVTLAGEERTHYAVYVRNLPSRPSDISLQDALYHEYKKICNVRSVRVTPIGRVGRFAVIYLASMMDVTKLLEEIRNKNFMGSLLESEKYLGGDELVEEKRLYYRPPDGDLDEFHPKATRTLYVGNLPRSDIFSTDIQQKFKEFGEILDIDVKKPGYAFVQFMDISSVVKAIKACDSDSWNIADKTPSSATPSTSTPIPVNSFKMKLGFGRAMPTKCVWIHNLAEGVTEKCLQSEFGRFGKIQDVLIDRSRSHALVYYDQTVKAQRGVLEMRGRILRGQRIETDYASHECRTAFFERIKDIRERSRHWDEDDRVDKTFGGRNTKGSERIGVSIESTSSGSNTRTRRNDDYHRNEYDDELKRFQNERVVVYASPSGYKSPSPTSSGDRSSRNYQRYSDRESIDRSPSLSGASKGITGTVAAAALPSLPLPVPLLPPRYKPLTTNISPPRTSSLEHYEDSKLTTGSGGDLRDSLNRKTHRYRYDHSQQRLSDPRRSHLLKKKQRGTPPLNSSSGDEDKKNGKSDSGLSEDLCSTGSSSGGNTLPEDRKLLPPLDTGLIDKVRRPSSDSARSLDSPNIREIPFRRRRRLSLESKNDDESESGSSRPGTPLCDENPENLNNEAPVRLSSHLRSEPMHLPLPRFAQHVLSPKGGSVSVTGSLVDDPRLKSPTRSPPPLPEESGSLGGGSGDGGERSSPPPLPPPLPSSSSSSHFLPPQGCKTPPSDDAEESLIDNLSLEERLRALDEKYQKWSGVSKIASPTTALSTSSSGLSSSHISNKLFHLDLVKPTTPSAIVQRLLSRKSVFDEDSKRLESRNGLTENPSPRLSSYHLQHHSHHLSHLPSPSSPSASLPLLSSLPSTDPNISSPIVPNSSVLFSDNYSSSLPRNIPTMPTVESSQKALVGQVKPTVLNNRAAPLPSIVGASTTTTPIKPLADKRQMVSTKPSATVTPTIKSTTSASGHSGTSFVNVSSGNCKVHSEESLEDKKSKAEVLPSSLLIVKDEEFLKRVKRKEDSHVIPHHHKRRRSSTSSSSKEIQKKMKEKQRISEWKDVLTATDTIKKEIKKSSLSLKRRRNSLPEDEHRPNSLHSSSNATKVVNKVVNNEEDTTTTTISMKQQQNTLKMGRIPKLPKKKEDNTVGAVGTGSGVTTLSSSRSEIHSSSRGSSKHHHHKSSSKKIHLQERKEKDKRIKDKEETDAITQSHRKRKRKEEDNKSNKRSISKKDKKSAASIMSSEERGGASDGVDDEDDNSSDTNENEPKKFSIFDEPIIDLNNPVYFSMYDKVKARRSCVARRDNAEEARKQQEALFEKFSKLKKKRAEKDKRGSGEEEEEEESEVFDSDASDVADLTTKKKRTATIISSSSERENEKENEEDGGEIRKRIFKKHSSTYKKSRDKKLPASVVSDDDSESEVVFKAKKKKSFGENDEKRKERKKVKVEIFTDSDFEESISTVATNAVITSTSTAVAAIAASAMTSTVGNGHKVQSSSSFSSSTTPTTIPLKKKTYIGENIRPLTTSDSSEVEDIKLTNKQMTEINKRCYSSKNIFKKGGGEEKTKDKKELDRKMFKIFGSSSDDDAIKKPLVKSSSSVVFVDEERDENENEDRKDKDKVRGVSVVGSSSVSLDVVSSSSSPSATTTTTTLSSSSSTTTTTTTNSNSVTSMNLTTSTTKKKGGDETHKKKKKKKHRRDTEKGERQSTAESLFDQLTTKVSIESSISSLPISSILNEDRDECQDKKKKNSLSSVISSPSRVAITPSNTTSTTVVMMTTLPFIEELPKISQEELLEQSIASITYSSTRPPSSSLDQCLRNKSTGRSSKIEKEMEEEEAIENEHPKRSVISREETDQAVQALLGESFEETAFAKQEDSLPSHPPHPDPPSSSNQIDFVSPPITTTTTNITNDMETMSAVAGIVQDYDEAASAVACITENETSVIESQEEEREEEEPSLCKKCDDEPLSKEKEKQESTQQSHVQPPRQQHLSPPRQQQQVAVETYTVNSAKKNMAEDKEELIITEKTGVASSSSINLSPGEESIKEKLDLLVSSTSPSPLPLKEESSKRTSGSRGRKRVIKVLSKSLQESSTPTRVSSGRPRSLLLHSEEEDTRQRLSMESTSLETTTTTTKVTALDVFDWVDENDEGPPTSKTSNPMTTMTTTTLFIKKEETTENNDNVMTSSLDSSPKHFLQSKIPLPVIVKENISSNDNETEVKIKAILVKAKLEEEEGEEESLSKDSSQTPLPLIDPETGFLRTNKSSASSSNDDGNYISLPRLFKKNPLSSTAPPPPTNVLFSPVAATQIGVPTVLPQRLSPSPLNVLLPTQPIPHSEIRKPKQVLLEQQQQLQQQQPLISPSHSVVVLPNTPLPMSSLGERRNHPPPPQIFCRSSVSIPRLPQHPLPPTMESSEQNQHHHLISLKPRGVDKNCSSSTNSGVGLDVIEKKKLRYSEESSFNPLQMIQYRQEAVNQELSLLYQHFLSKNHPEPLAMTLATQVLQDRFKGSTPVDEEEDHLRPPAAHEHFRRATESPLPAHAHSRIPNTNPYLLLPDYPSPSEFTLPNLEAYPVVWQGFLGLKNDYATVQFHYVSGQKDLARASLPPTSSDPLDLPTLRIGQRMRLEASQLDGVSRKMQLPAEHCILLALPCGKDTRDVEIQSRQLRNHFITYLQLKSAAGIVNVSSMDGDHVVHVFPSCDFANETMGGIAPDLLARVADIEHMVIIIATVFDNR